MEFLLKPLSFSFCIFLGYILRRIGFFSKDDYKVITKIMMNITLPATVVYTFRNFSSSENLILLAVAGLVCSFIPLIIGYLIPEKDKYIHAYVMLNIGGYSIGTFSLPIIIALFGPSAAIVTIFFDIGNAIMMTGGAYTLTQSLLKLDGERTTLKTIMKTFLKSAPFDTYMLMLIFFVTKIPLPQFVFTFAEPIANANVFIAMFMLGMMFEFSSDKTKMQKVVKVLMLRQFIAIIYALIFYNVPFFAPDIQRLLAIIAFSPVGALSAIYTERISGDGSLSSFTISVSIIIGLIEMTLLGYLL